LKVLCGVNALPFKRVSLLAYGSGYRQDIIAPELQPPVAQLARTSS